MLNLEWILIKKYSRYRSNYCMSFNHSAKRKSDSTNFMFSRDSLSVVHKGSTYNFRLDERTKESENSVIKGKI